MFIKILTFMFNVIRIVYVCSLNRATADHTGTIVISDREMVNLDGVEVVSDKKESEPILRWSKAFRYRKYGGRGS